MSVILIISVLSYSSIVNLSPVPQENPVRVACAVFVLIPHKNTQTRKEVLKPGSPCPCPEEDQDCLLDQDLECRKTLNIKQTEEIVISLHYKRHRRRKLKKLFKKWIQQGGDHS